VQEYLNGKTPAPSPQVYLLFGKPIDDVSDEEKKSSVHLMAVLTTMKALNLLEQAKKQKDEKAGMDMTVTPPE
jgi:hypothetical protein